MKSKRLLKKNLPLLIEGFAQKAKALEKPLIVLFQDEARFGRVQDPKRCWCPKQTRPKVKSQLVREYLYAYGAVNPVDGTFISLCLPKADTFCMELFLQEVMQTYPDAYVVIFLDQAAWHKSKALKVPSNIHLTHIPPYSPELNPVEMAWKIIRKDFFHNIYFNSLQAVEQRLCQALGHHLRHKETFASACKFLWIINPILNAT